MGRTNLVILFFGLFACVTLSLMMKHVVTVKKEGRVNPAVSELYSVFRQQLRKAPALETVEIDGRKSAVLTVTPKDSVKPQYEPRFAKAIGSYFKQSVPVDFEFSALTVVVQREAGERRFVIPVRRRGFSRFGQGAKRSAAKPAKQPAPKTARKSTPVKSPKKATPPPKPAAPPVKK